MTSYLKGKSILKDYIIYDAAGNLLGDWLLITVHEQHGLQGGILPHHGQMICGDRDIFVNHNITSLQRLFLSQHNVSGTAGCLVLHANVFDGI